MLIPFLNILIGVFLCLCFISTIKYTLDFKNLNLIEANSDLFVIYIMMSLAMIIFDIQLILSIK